MLSSHRKVASGQISASELFLARAPKYQSTSQSGQPLNTVRLQLLTDCYRLRSWFWAPLLILTVTCVSSTSNPQMPAGLSIHDKLAHVLVFGLLATTIIRIPRLFETKYLGIVLSILIPSLFGFVDELHQSFTPGRTMEFMDWVADTGGAILATLSYRYWSFYRNLLEYPAIKRNPFQWKVTSQPR